MAESTLPFPASRRSSNGGSGDAAPAIGRTLPHSIEAEEYLLSCCLLDGSDVVSRCLEARIRPESFYVSAHGVVFEKLLDLYNRQMPIDVSVATAADARQLKVRLWVRQYEVAAFLTVPDPEGKPVWDNDYDLPAWTAPKAPAAKGEALAGKLTFQYRPVVVRAQLGDEAGQLGAGLLALSALEEQS